MSTTPAATALDWLRRQLSELSGFRNATTRDTQFKQWRQNTLTVIQRIWPGVTDRSRRFKRVPFAPASNLADSREMRESFERGCAEAGDLLLHWIQEIEEHGVQHEPADKARESVDVADYATTLTLDHAPSEPATDSTPEDEVPTLDLPDVPTKGRGPTRRVKRWVEAVERTNPGPAEPAAETPPPAQPAAPGVRKVRRAAPKSKTRLKEMLGLSHLSAAQGATDHSESVPPPAESGPEAPAFPAPPPAATPSGTFPAPPPNTFPVQPAATPSSTFPAPPTNAFPAPPPASTPSSTFPAPPPSTFPAPPPVATPSGTFPAPPTNTFPAPPPGATPSSTFPAPPPAAAIPAPPSVSAFPEQPVALSPAQDEFEDLEDLEAPDNHVFARREIDLGAANDESYESMVEELEEEDELEEEVEELEVEAEEPVAPARPHQPPDLIVFPPIAEVAPPSPQNPPPPRPPSSAFPAPAPIAAEPPRSAEPPLELDPTSILQVVSVDAPRASDFAIGMGSDDIGPGRFSSRTAPVAALAAELDHMDIPPIDRVALKRFLIDLALRLESDTCAWVDLRAAIITVMEYPQLARRALPALLPFLDRAA